jgi:hypothetical protein
MPNAHNGYYGRELEMGSVGLGFLYVSSLQPSTPLAASPTEDPVRARLRLSLALFFIMLNYFESLRIRGFESLWIVFPITAAEIGRYWQSFPLRQPFPLKKAAYQPVDEVRLR